MKVKTNNKSKTKAKKPIDKKSLRTKYDNVIRYIFGIVLVLGGMAEIKTQPAFSFSAVLLGGSLLPMLYGATPLGKVKHLQVILPCVLFVLTFVFFKMGI